MHNVFNLSIILSILLKALDKIHVKIKTCIAHKLHGLGIS